MSDFRKLDEKKFADLYAALKGNGEGDVALMTGPDTSFVGTMPKNRISEEEVISAISSIPSHY